MTRESDHTSASTSPPYSRLVTPGLLVAIVVALLAILFGLSPQFQLRGSSALKLLSRLPTTIQSTPVTSVSRPLSTSMSSSNQKTSAKEEKEWNHLAELMEYYHNHFRHSFNSIYELADGKFEKRGMSLRMFIQNAGALASQLDMHHNIEERHLFPILAKKMPQFKAGARESGEHLKSHKAIHQGLDRYNALLEKYSETPNTYSPDELRACLDSFRDVLFRHLDEEVEDLKGESLKKAGWTLTELRQIPM